MKPSSTLSSQRKTKLPLIAIAFFILSTPHLTMADTKHPDLSGFWNLTSSAKPLPAMMARIAPDTAFLNDTGAPELSRGDYGGLKLKPAALTEATAWNPRDDLTVSKVCSPPSIVYAMQAPFPIEIYQGKEFILMKLEYYDLIRIVFMDGRAHPGVDAPHSKMGHSIGHWEGQTLVVETTHLAAATITNNGLNHSEKIRVIERYQLSADKKMLNSTQEFEDPETLNNRGSRFIAWTKKLGDHVFPYECDPAFAVNYDPAPAAAH